MLAEHPETRVDNRPLLFDVWERQGLRLAPEQWRAVPALLQPEMIRPTQDE